MDSLLKGYIQVMSLVMKTGMPRRAKRKDMHVAAPVWTGAVHDFRQPNQSLLLLVDVVSETRDEARRKQTARVMQCALRDLQTMLEATSELAGFVAGTREVVLTPNSMQTVFQDLDQSLAAPKRVRGIHLQRKCAAGRLDCNADLLHKIIAALVGQALHTCSSNEIIPSCGKHAERGAWARL